MTGGQGEDEPGGQGLMAGEKTTGAGPLNRHFQEKRAVSPKAQAMGWAGQRQAQWIAAGRRLNSEQSSTSPSLARQQTIDGWIPDQLLVVWRVDCPSLIAWSLPSEIDH